MSDDVRRTQAESKKKIGDVVRKRTAPTGPPVSRFRNTPAGRRLAALRDKKNEDA